MKAPRLAALATATPPHELGQEEIARRAADIFRDGKDITRLMPVFTNTGIDTRYSAAPIDWYAQPHGWADRSELFIDTALPLLEKVARQCLAQARLDTDDIDGIVVASTTGIATPSLDALLVERMGLRRDIKRLPIFGLGCAGGVTGLSRAADMAKAAPGSKVLFLVVELCTLTFRKSDLSKSNIVAAALFADGAAGAILCTDMDGPALIASGEHTWANSLDIMGWDIEDDGLKARFAQSIPMLVSTKMEGVLTDFLRRNDLKLSDFSRFACHPGGAKVLDALEDVFGLARGELIESREVLRQFGNMSAATVMFVLASMDWRAKNTRTLLSALGPGFSATFAVLEA